MSSAAMTVTHRSSPTAGALFMKSSPAVVELVLLKKHLPLKRIQDLCLVQLDESPNRWSPSHHRSRQPWGATKYQGLLGLVVGPLCSI